MAIKKDIYRNFQTKVTLAFMFSLLFIAGLGGAFIYEFSLKSEFENLQQALRVVVNTAVLNIDAKSLLKIPLNHDGVNSEEYKLIARQLQKIKEINPMLRYIYTMAKTDQPDKLQFIVDPSAVSEKPGVKGVTSFPGDRYDIVLMPQMKEAFSRVTVDKKITDDPWGAFLSGYAPVNDENGNPVAILGVDIDARTIHNLQENVKIRLAIIFLAGIFISIMLGFLVSRRVTDPIENLVEGTRRISAGDLSYKVQVKGRDEISELARSFNEMADSLVQSRKELRDYFYRIVQAMVRSLEAKDHYTRGHSDRVSKYAGQIAREMGLPEEKCELLEQAAQLHDIGKIGVSEEIINKKSVLSDDEWDLMHKHPQIGEEIIKPIFLDKDMFSVVRSHHEYYDGSGYPDRLKGDQISIYAQITSVADSYDAMASSRSYRTALTKDEAIARLKEQSGRQFSPKVVEAFVRVLTR